MRKRRRKLNRQKKAKALAPRPRSLLRPIVHCASRRYASKLRFGRGFTLLELKEAGINVNEAPTIGISVDKRRYNKSQESLDRNVERLKEYKSKLIVFGKKSKVAAEIKELKLVKDVNSADDVAVSVGDVETAEITEEMKTFNARSFLRKEKAYNYTAVRAAHPDRNRDKED
eukprot:augustus_masked-scaffold_75-processed-gene-0.1-mRNA-1 protein AED:0.39 eAED:0.39 QI:0/-1/0/1/-1/1/1/0/171